MAWTSPTTRATGDLITASIWNIDLVNNLLAINPQPATTLPGSPADGDIALLVDSLTAPTYAWRLRYESGVSDANKWVCIGGAAALVEVATRETMSGAAYADLATAGPSFTAPRAGVYNVEVGCESDSTSGVASAAYAAVKIGAAATSDANRVAATSDGGSSSSVQAVSIARGLRLTAAAADALKVQYKADGTNVVGFAKRYISVMPVRVA